jgi:Uma2 family endonuclease
VPDVAFVAAQRLRGLRGADLEVPRLAPDAVVEILSPDDRRGDVDDKIATYLRAGSSLVVVVDARAHTAELHDQDRCVVLRANDILAHSVLPGFALSLADVFSAIEPWGDPPQSDEARADLPAVH